MPASRRRTAGGSRCRPTRRSPSACSRWSGRASPPGCAPSCSRSPSSTTSWRSIVIAVFYSEDIEPRAVARRNRDLLRSPRGSRRRHSQRDPVPRRRHRRVGRCPQVGRRSDRGRPRLRAHHVRLPVVAVGARARHRALPRLPRAADARAGADRAAGAPLHHLPERAPAAGLPPVDELSDRPDLRARERGCRPRREIDPPRSLVTGDARDRRRLRRRQARRDRGRVLARDPAHARAPAAAGGLGRRPRRRHDRRDRVHRLAPRRVTRVRGRHAGRREDRDHRRGR